jgi:hypothetical protein
MIYVHVTDQCKEDAAKHGQLSLLKSVQQKVESTQSLVNFDFFPPTKFVKKRLGWGFRMIGFQVSTESGELLLFLRVLTRESKEYKDFLDNHKKETQRFERLWQTYSQTQLREIYREIASQPPAKPLPEPNDEERAWLYKILDQRDIIDDLIILETNTWVKKMRTEETRDFLAMYHEAIDQRDLAHLSPASSNNDCQVHWTKTVGFAYLYRPDLNRLLLLEPLKRDDDADTILANHRRDLAKIGEAADELSRIAGRSYPYLMVFDQKAWLTIQKDEEANLALSPEEADILASVRRAYVQRESTYPLFINGQAGSGKSTMLQYLTAQYVDFAIRHSTQLLPIYLTANKELLERARNVVRGLLTTHYQYLYDGVPAPTKVNAVLDKSFVVFYEFLRSLLQPQTSERFLPENRVTYAKFKRLWATDFSKRPEARRLNPDIAWHTIRSYIKGRRSTPDDDLSPEEFEALPQKHRSVSIETFRLIYDHVWHRWYKRLCDSEGYWDDQDLAVQALNSEALSSMSFAAVFCDEAQDFTPVELDLIFQLSVYARRSLHPEELRQVPIAFAGDPLQTINPTGFRWETVGADFYDRFCAVLDPRRRASIKPNYKELRFNYRSNSGIVQFCNLIQLIRVALLGYRELRPQEAWGVEVATQPAWFSIEDYVTQQQLQQRPDFVKLVNCDEGEETDFAKRDPTLSQMTGNKDDVFQNVFSPMRAKGLEFPAVIIYRFAETAPNNFQQFLTKKIDLQHEAEHRLAFEYFLNRLYVAASRAKNQLFIVDSSDTFNSFWRFATDPDIVDRLKQDTKEPHVWKRSVVQAMRGLNKLWSGQPIDFKEQAHDYATQGCLREDPYLMRQAALAYRSAGEELEARKCLALAVEFEGDLSAAGDRYRDLGILDEAFRCYWKSQNFARISKIIAKDSLHASRLECLAADFMINRSNMETFLKKVLRTAKDPSWRAEVTKDATWKSVLNKLAEHLVQETSSTNLPWLEMCKIFQQLHQDGLLQKQHLGVISYRAGDYNTAVDIWDEFGETHHRSYWQAKANLSPFPDNIKWLSRLNRSEDISKEWQKHRTTVADPGTLDDTIYSAIVNAAFDMGDYKLGSV